MNADDVITILRWSAIGLVGLVYIYIAARLVGRAVIRCIKEKKGSE